MIDAGGNGNERFIINYLAKIGAGRIDYLFFTHPHEDHIGSLDAVIKVIDIGKLYMPKAANDTKAYGDVLSAIKQKNLDIINPKAGDIIISDAANHIYLSVMAPAKAEYVNLNNYSIILKLAYAGTSFLFNGDAEDILEYEMIDSGLDIDVDVVKIGHHGSDTSTSEAFLTAASPQYAVISVGENNIYGLPSQSIIDKINKAGIKILRTDELGTIIASSDGKSIWFEHENKAPDIAVAEVATDSKISAKAEIATDSKESAKTEQHTGDETFIGNKNSKIFHTEYCHTLPKKSNQVIFGDRDAAIKAGYRPCKNCNP